MKDRLPRHHPVVLLHTQPHGEEYISHGAGDAQYHHCQMSCCLLIEVVDLLDMAARRPRTPGEFAEVFGVGAAKQKKFADAFLQAIATDTLAG